MTEQCEHVKDWIVIRAWVKNRGGQVFPTFAAVSSGLFAAIAQRLVESGQLIIRKGSAGSLVGPGFDRVVLEIMREESARAIEGEAA
ncbi:MAG: hypothetical protein MZV65_25025 [Chromatiales bacterium]|nr:hypothetical protein [Chromatiales bacterium]